MKAIIISICMVLLLAASAEAISMDKRNQLTLKVGIWNQITDTKTEVGINGVETSVGSNGMFGGISYGHWLEEYLALTFSIEGMMLDISTKVDGSGVNSETSSIGLILMGVKYNFLKSTLETSVRPYIKGCTGMFIGSQSNTKVGLIVGTESRTETAFGGQVGAGMDFIVSRHFMLGMSMVYSLMTDFNNPIGGSKNYSGPHFGFEFSWIFGKGRE